MFGEKAEAEREYACRGGTAMTVHSGPGFPQGTDETREFSSFDASLRQDRVRFTVPSDVPRAPMPHRCGGLIRPQEVARTASSEVCCQKNAARNLTSAVWANPRETPDGAAHGGSTPVA